jgi:hypothetical protein
MHIKARLFAPYVVANARQASYRYALRLAGHENPSLLFAHPAAK